MTITPADRSMLAKLLGLVGSHHDGEALSAARKAHALVMQRNATWLDVLAAAPQQPSPAADCAPPQEAGHVTIARELLGKGRGIITAWEKSFLIGIMAYHSPKPKQLDMLELIRRKVLCDAHAE